MPWTLQQGHSRRGVLPGRDVSTVDPGNDLNAAMTIQ